MSNVEQVSRAGQLHLRAVSRASEFKQHVKSRAGPLELSIYNRVVAVISSSYLTGKKGSCTENQKARADPSKNKKQNCRK